jgi:MATE family multidrug resistance protein
LAFNVNTLAFIPMMGCGTAVMTLVGKRIGEGRPEIAVRTTWMACSACCLYMSGFAIIFVILPDVILYPFSLRMPADEFAALREIAVVLLRFLAAFTVLDGMAIIFGSAIRGAGDTRFSLVFTLITSWFLMVLPTWICWQWYGGHLIASWTACTVYICVLGIGMMIRFQSGRWKTMRVIEQTDAIPRNEDAARSDTSQNDPLSETVSAIDEPSVLPRDRVHDEVQNVSDDRL